jgi:hypothetical protein
LLKGFVGVLSGEPNSAKLKKEENRGEKEFKIFAGFTGTSDNILPTFGIIPSVPSTKKDSNFTISSNSSSKIF